MAYTPAADSGSDEYAMVLRHNGSGILFEIKIAGVQAGSPPPTRATKDNVFQGALDRLIGLPGSTLVTARRTITYQSDVTPTP